MRNTGLKERESGTADEHLPLPRGRLCHDRRWPKAHNFRDEVRAGTIVLFSVQSTYRRTEPGLFFAKPETGQDTWRVLHQNDRFYVQGTILIQVNNLVEGSTGHCS